MVSKMGKSGMMGGKGNAQQKQLAAQMRKNPNQVMQRINQMDPRMLQQMGGKEAVMQMMQSMGNGGGGMPDMSAMMNSMGGGGSGGMPDMASMMQSMGAGGGMPPGGGLPPGMDMNSISQMMASMGMGGPPPQQPRR